MEISFDVIHVAKIGDKPTELKFNDVNKEQTVNMYLNGEHYRIDLDKLERAINAIK